MIFIWNLTEGDCLQKQEQTEIDGLMAACREKEALSLPFPDDAGLVLGFYEEKRLDGLLAICEAEPGTGECYAFTRPECRGRGIFTDLMDAALDYYEKQEEEGKEGLELVLVSDGKSPDAALVQAHLALPLWYEEYQMELVTHTAALEEGADSPNAPIALHRSVHAESDGTRFLLYTAADVSCRLLPCGENRFYLYHLEVAKSARGRGLGTIFLHTLLKALPAGTKLRLQVSSDNPPALALYKKAGFRITETLSYYEY